MKPLLSPQAVGVLLGLALTSGAALAQSAEVVNPQPVAAEPRANEEPPPGSCKPIGFTVSGEIVFPMECKAFIERQKTLDRKPAAQARPAGNEEKAAAPQGSSVVGEAKPALEAKPASDDKPAAEEATPAAAQEKAANAAEKPVAGQNDGGLPEINKPSSEPAETGSLPKRARREPGVGPSGCTHFRTYNAASGTYKTFDGQQRPCRESNGAVRDVVGIRCGAISGNMKVPFQAARSIG
jgi:BA14K-like protein